jgi:hypothetical protein
LTTFMVAAYRLQPRRTRGRLEIPAGGRNFRGQRVNFCLENGRPVQVTDFRVFLVMATALGLSACAGALPTSTGPAASAAPASNNIAQRELTPEEKKAIVDAVAPSLRDAAAAKYHWAKFPAVTLENSVNYCATVDAKSPYAAYDGHQAYIIEAQLSGGKVTSATMGLIAGGKDLVLVSKMCAKYGLDPNKAS